MEVVHKGEGTDLIKQMPKAPTYFDGKGKRHFENIARILIAAEILKEKHLLPLEILAQNKAQHEWAIREINRKNKKRHGSGYIQNFQSGASNITAEVSLKEKAEKVMLQCIKQFGLDPRSEKELNIEPANQTNLLEALGLAK